MTDWKAKLKALDPCPEAYRWAIEHKTLREAWRMCEVFAWMQWLAIQCGDPSERDAIQAVNQTTGGQWKDDEVTLDTPCDELELQDAYICLDFMPNPPRLPEIT